MFRWSRRPQRGRWPSTCLAACLAMVVPGPSAAQPVASSRLCAPHELSASYRNGSRFMGIRLLGALRLKPVRVDGQPLRELSGLAWDQDEELLYAVSDGGRLFHFRPEFDGALLTGLSAVAGYALEGPPGGRPMTRAWSDSEDLAIENGDNGVTGDSRLVVSFERRPRLARYSPEGRLLEPIALPAPLSEVASYASANKSLESVARHPAFGLLTAPEWPLIGSAPRTVEIWSTAGKSWAYLLRDVPNNALVAMEALEDGSLVTLERGHGLLYSPLIISLRRTFPLAPEPRSPARVSTAAVFDSSAGWRIDNFEGLARHRGLRFFVVSDDNENPLQVTLMLYLEIVDPVATDYAPPESGIHQENRR
jgi:hypothetical protein